MLSDVSMENMQPLIATLTLFVFFAASYGYGFATMKWGIRSLTNSFSLQAVVGVASLTVLGGLLNLASMAYPFMMYVLLLLGLIFFMLSLFPRLKLLPQLNSLAIPDRLLPPFLVVMAVIFFAATLLPSNVFNPGDDFFTYILRPVRMLQTGSLAGNPYEVLGLDSLGAQAFLQGFFLLKLPVEYLSGFDSVFGLCLAGLLLTAIARKFKLGWIYAMPAILTFLVISPQSANLSALYSGTFSIIGLLLISCLLTEKLNETEFKKPLGMAALAGLLISLLAALKSTLAIFAAIYFVFICMCLFVIMQNKRHAFLLSAATGLTAVIAISPWLLLSLPNYLAAIKISSHASNEANVSGFSLPKGNVGELFSTQDLFYGGSMMGYGTILMVLAVLVFLSVIIVFRNRSQTRQSGYLLVSASACAAAIASYFVNGLLFAPEVAIRYSNPVLIATLPFALLVSSFSATVSHYPAQPEYAVRKTLKIAIFGGAALVFALFGSNLLDRIERAYNNRTIMSFPIADDYKQYNKYVLSDKARKVIRDIQEQTDPGTKILAWISMPLHLDFSRNQIQTVMEPGLINPWLNLPQADDPAEFTQYLKKQGVRYILWEYQGIGMKNQSAYERMLYYPFPVYRRIAERNLYFRKMLISVMEYGDFLYDLDGIVLFDLNQVH
jgi:hypothetical protein